MEISFANPEYLWLLLAVPLLISLHMLGMRFMSRKAFNFANFRAVARVLGSSQDLSRNTFPLILRSFALILFSLSLAGLSVSEEVVVTDMDFTIAIDTSSSMMTDDFEPNRLEAAKESIGKFIGSFSDIEPKIGLVRFAGVAETVVPPTAEQERLQSAVATLSLSQSGGTAVGDAIVLSTNYLMTSEKEKALILITDGQNNIGVSPEEAVRLASHNNVTIHTIGVGTEEGGKIGNLTLLSKLDEESLMSIASATGGQYFHVTSEQELDTTIQSLQSTSMKMDIVNFELYLMLGGIALLLVEWMLVNTKYRTLP